jgi:hypothetical protein
MWDDVDESMGASGETLEKEKQEMRALNSVFEEKTKKLAHVLNLQYKEEGGGANEENGGGG